MKRAQTVGMSILTVIMAVLAIEDFSNGEILRGSFAATGVTLYLLSLAIQEN